MKKALKKLKINKIMKDFFYFGRVYGGAILFARVDDGQELDKPLNFNRIHKVMGFTVYDAAKVTYSEEDTTRDYLSENFGEPEYYRFLLDNQNFVKVHHTRCFRICGKQNISNRESNRLIGYSVLQPCFEALRNYGLVSGASAEIVTDFIQVIIKLNDLDAKMQQPEGMNTIRRRMSLLDRSRSASNLIAIDSDKESYEKSASSVAGLSELWGKFAESICSVTGYPMTRLFGQSPGGLNSTGISDMRNYYDLVSAYRTDEIEPVLDWVVKLVLSQGEWSGDKDDVWSFASLVEQTPLEISQIKKTYAEIDCMYVDRGAIDAGEAWQERFGQDRFNEDIKLAIKEPEDDLTEDDLSSVVTLSEKEKDMKKQRKKDDLEVEALVKLKNYVESI